MDTKKTFTTKDAEKLVKASLGPDSFKRKDGEMKGDFGVKTTKSFIEEIRKTKKTKAKEKEQFFPKSLGAAAAEEKSGDPYEIEDKELTREEIDDLYSEVKNVKKDEEENPSFDVSELGKSVDKNASRVNNKLDEKKALENSVKQIAFFAKQLKNQIDKDFQNGKQREKYKIVKTLVDIDWKRFNGKRDVLEQIFIKAQEDVDSYLKLKSKQFGPRSLGAAAAKEKLKNPKTKNKKTLQQEKPEFVDAEVVENGIEIKGSEEVVDVEHIDVEKGGLPIVLEKKKNEKLEKLRQELEIARKEYAEMYFKKRKMWDRVKGFFGDKFTKEGQERGGRVKIEHALNASGQETDVYSDQDVNYLGAIYENILLDYKNALLEDIKERGVSGKELEKELTETMKLFNLDEATNLYDAKTEARLDHAAKDSSSWGKIKELGAKTINWYVKLPTWKKIAFSGAILGGTLGSGALGMGAASFFTMANLGRRVLAGSASAVGAEAILEKKAGKMREKKSKKEIENELSKFEMMTDEEKLEKINSFLQGKVFEVNEKFDKRNLGSFLRKSGSIAFATLMAGPIMSKFFQFTSENSGMGKFFRENIFNKVVIPEGPDGNYYQKNSSYFPEQEGKSTGRGAFHIEDHLAEKETVQLKNIIEVQEGESLEGSMVKHLKANPGLIEKYNEMNGGRNFNAEQIAHRMALDYADKNSEAFPQGPPSLVYEGTEIKVNPETMRIEDIQHEKGTGYIQEEGSVEVPETENSETEKPDNTESVLEKKPEMKVEPEKNNIEENIELDEEKRLKTDVETDVETEVEEKEPEIKFEKNEDSNINNSVSTKEGDLKEPEIDWGVKEGMDVEKMIESREKVIEIFGSKGYNSGDLRVDAMKYLSENNREKWSEIKDVKFTRGGGTRFSFNEEVDKEVRDRIRNICKVLPDDLVPKKGEKVLTWIGHSFEDFGKKQAA